MRYSDFLKKIINKFINKFKKKKKLIDYIKEQNTITNVTLASMSVTTRPVAGEAWFLFLYL